jgi:WD40 repeat protein
MWKMPNGESKVFGGHGEKAEVARILPDGRRAVVGYGDGAIKVFDLKSGEVVHSVAKAHNAAVSALAVRNGAGQLVSNFSNFN